MLISVAAENKGLLPRVSSHLVKCVIKIPEPLPISRTNSGADYKFKASKYSTLNKKNESLLGR